MGGEGRRFPGEIRNKIEAWLKEDLSQKPKYRRTAWRMHEILKYEPEFCNPARGNEKGRVENKIGYIRRNFFSPIPHFSSIEELNSRLLSFAEASSRSTKAHPDFADKTCYEVYEEEKDKLIELPPYGFDCCRVQHAVVSHTSTVAFDNNKYSIPSEYDVPAVMVKGYADGDRYFAKTLILLKDWPLMNVVEAVKKAVGLGILGDSYILRILRQSEHPESEIEYLSIKIELARYKAGQMPLTHYDRVLRFKTGISEIKGKGQSLPSQKRGS